MNLGHSSLLLAYKIERQFVSCSCFENLKDWMICLDMIKHRRLAKKRDNKVGKKTYVYLAAASEPNRLALDRENCQCFRIQKRPECC